MNPENLRRLEGIHINSSMVEASDEALVERVEAQMAAMQEVLEAYLGTRSEGDEAHLPERFDEALGYAVKFIYRTGCEAFGEDLERAFDTDLGYRKYDEGDMWVPETEAEQALVKELAAIGFGLAYHDNEPAFRPHIKGRSHEILDPYDASYNKYGLLVPGSQTYGSHL